MHAVSIISADARARTFHAAMPLGRRAHAAITALHSPFIMDRSPVSQQAAMTNPSYNRTAWSVLTAAMPQKLQTNEATRAPEKQGSTAKTPADAQARVQLMDFTSRRSPVLGTRGMVASSQPLASEVCLHF